jgi:hypothetical protein
MDINVFLLCYNEQALLAHTIKHYKKYLPSCKITIYDNESTDNSVEIAKSYDCNVVSWSSDNIHNEDIQIELRNTIWKNIPRGWIIMADMDEFVCVSETELLYEMNQGTSILQIAGKDMVGESNTIDLSDIDLQQIRKCVDNTWESKNLCFLREKIDDMNYAPGSHSCKPIGTIKYSSNVYINKHMQYIGLQFITNKQVERYKRNELMRKKNWNVHYINDVNIIKLNYLYLLESSHIMN